MRCSAARRSGPPSFTAPSAAAHPLNTIPVSARAPRVIGRGRTFSSCADHEFRTSLEAVLFPLAATSLVHRLLEDELPVANVQQQPDASGTLTVRTPKTDQDGRVHARYLGPPTIAAVTALAAGGGSDHGPAIPAYPQGRPSH